MSWTAETIKWQWLQRPMGGVVHTRGWKSPSNFAWSHVYCWCHSKTVISPEININPKFYRLHPWHPWRWGNRKIHINHFCVNNCNFFHIDFITSVLNDHMNYLLIFPSKSVLKLNWKILYKNNQSFLISFRYCFVFFQNCTTQLIALQIDWMLQKQYDVLFFENAFWTRLK